MAIAKRRKAAPRRKSGAPKKRKTKVAGSPDKVKIAGQNFSKSSCHTNKSAAQGRAETVRSGGTRARVIKSGKAYCVYTGGKSKTATRRRAA